MRKYFYAPIIMLICGLLASCISVSEVVTPQAEIYEQQMATLSSIPTSTSGSVEVGDTIHFGGLDWRILEMHDDDTALLITENIIFRSAFHNTWESVTWEESDIRAYLNSIFLDEFSNGERRRILPKHIHTPDNRWYLLTPGGNDTTDYVFLLCSEEVVRFFGGGEAWSPGSESLYASSHSRQWWVCDEYNVERMAFNENGEATWWWLRSPGFDIDFAVSVSEYGRIHIDGSGVHTVGGIRPALLLNLTP